MIGQTALIQIIDLTRLLQITDPTRKIQIILIIKEKEKGEKNAN